MGKQYTITHREDIETMIKKGPLKGVVIGVVTKNSDLYINITEIPNEDYFEVADMCIKNTGYSYFGRPHAGPVNKTLSSVKDILSPDLEKQIRISLKEGNEKTLRNMFNIALLQYNCDVDADEFITRDKTFRLFNNLDDNAPQSDYNSLTDLKSDLEVIHNLPPFRLIKAYDELRSKSHHDGSIFLLKRTNITDVDEQAKRIPESIKQVKELLEDYTR